MGARISVVSAIALLLLPLDMHAARPMVVAGHGFSAALHSNGTVYMWGSWNCGSAVNTGVPELIPGLTGVTSLAAGNGHLLALRSDGTVLALGGNDNGELGIGGFTSTCTPTPVAGLSGVTAIAAGAFDSYALLADGSVRSWGYSLFGALGAAGSDRPLPGPVGLPGPATAIASGADASFALAIRQPGTVWAWGDNLLDQLGFSTGGYSWTSTPGQSGALFAARRIAAGSYHSIASTNDGRVYTWGWNNDGELGAGTIGGAERLTPATVPGLTGVIEIAASQFHNVVVRYDGTVWTWGQGTFGQLGNGGASNRGSPVQAVGISNAVQAAAGSAHSLVLGSDGGVWGFGLGLGGAVGDAAFTTRTSPVRVVGPGGVGLLNLGAVAPTIPAADSDSDGIPDILEAGEGRNLVVKDNDIFTSARWFAMQQYRDFLAREGDPGGIAFWTNQINAGAQTRELCVQSFFNSAEFQSTVSPVVRLYFAYFRRIPDYPGLQFWINYFNSGHSLDEISNFFATSPEFASTYGALNNSQYVNLVYQNVLGRAPDVAGFNFWVNQLNTSAMTRGQVMRNFSESAEYQAASFNPVYVTMMYVAMLRRSPDQGGFDFWVGYMNAGNPGLSLIAGFIASTEYHLRFLGPAGPSPAAGIYHGTSAAGEPVLGMVTPTGAFYFLHFRTSSPSAVFTVDSGIAPAGAGAISATGAVTLTPLEYIDSLGTLQPASTTAFVGSFSGGYSPGSSLMGSFGYTTAATASVSLTFASNSLAPASLAAVPTGTFSGKMSHSNLNPAFSRFDWAPSISFSISPAGLFTGSVSCQAQRIDAANPVCSINGTLTPRADMNAFDASFAFSEAGGGLLNSQFDGKTFNGLAYYEASSGKFYFVALAGDNTTIAFSN